MPTYSLIYTPIWVIRDRTGAPAAGAKLYTFLASDKSTPSPFYKDAGGTNPYTNPIVASDPEGEISGEVYGEDGLAYYLEAYDADGNLLWTVDNYLPPAPSGGSPTINYYDNDNYFRNSDFRFNYYPDTVKTLTNLTTDVPIAPGDWFFKKNNTSGQDNITFVSFSAGQTDVPFSPKYFLRYQCTSAGSSESKYIYVRFSDVYTFSGQSISIALQGRSSTSSTITIDYQQNFGTGGSSSVTNNVASQALTTDWARYEKTNLAIASISGKSIGTGSYLELRIGLPADAISQIDLVQLQLELGTKVNPYEYEDDAINRYRTVGGELPMFNPGNNQNQTDSLSPSYTPTGTMELIGGTVPTGSVLMHLAETAPTGYLLCNGATYNTTGSDTNYIRLYQVIGQNFGVGKDGYHFFYPKTTTTDSDDTIYTNTNIGQVCSSPSDSGTGFTFTVDEAGKAPVANMLGYVHTTVSGQLSFICSQFAPLSAAPTVGTLGGLTLNYYITGVTSNRKAEFSFTFPSQPSITGGQYWLFSNTTTDYYVWYTVNGSGTDPAIASRTGIQVKIITGDTAEHVAQKTYDSIAGRERLKIVCLAESAFSAGAYFDIFSGSNAARIWYSIGGTGTAPSEPTSKLLKEVALTGGETATQVAAATQTAIQELQFQVPNFSGYFPRFSDLTETRDPERAKRYSPDYTISTTEGDKVGSSQDMQTQYHTHEYQNNPGGEAMADEPGSLSNTVINSDTAGFGEFETRPINVYLVPIIKT